MKIGVSERDKILISSRQAEDVGYVGGVTSSDPGSCWVVFGSNLPRPKAASAVEKPNKCFLKSSNLPDGGLSSPPEFVSVTTKDESDSPKEAILLPVLDQAHNNRIDIGGFPGGDVSRFRVHFRDGSSIEFVDRETVAVNPTQSEIEVLPRGEVNFYRKKILRRLATPKSGD